MSEMVERVAYAIALYEMRAKTPTLAAFCESIPEARAAAVAQAVETYGGTARAAIEVMREPTEVMLLNRYGEESGFEGPSVHEAKLTWRFMIDAALKEDAHG